MDGFQGIFAALSVDINDIDIIVLLDGQIGEIRGEDRYDIKARGLSVAYASTRSQNAGLNDTGINQCFNGVVLSSCPVEGFPDQDAQSGRDFLVSNSADGHAGFSFTKIGSNGEELPASATEWDCVQDNVTGHWWEVKGPDHSTTLLEYYVWHNDDYSVNGGDAGSQYGTTIFTRDNGNTQNYIKKINNIGLCGRNDWQLPTLRQFQSIIHYGVEDSNTPLIDLNYFPNTSRDWYWTSTTSANHPGFVMTISYSGSVSRVPKSAAVNGTALPVRVRLMSLNQSE